MAYYPKSELSLIRAASAAVVTRIIERADRLARQKANAQRGDFQAVLQTPTKSVLRSIVKKALCTTSRQLRNVPSLRLSAPDTGGIPFHLGLTWISKASVSSSGTKGKAGNSRKAHRRATTTEGAHQLYVEREGVVAEPGPLPVSRAQDSSYGSAPMAQRYIENPIKTMSDEGLASFGTIGSTMAERQSFWEQVHATEAKNGRTQHRLVLELPHEANDAIRAEIVRRFTRDAFEQNGIPYWAAIHRPTGKNDDRNYHAHIVFTDRPARKMTNPETGEQVWDFTITTRERDSSRHYVTKRPFKQNKDRTMSGRKYPERLRELYAQTANIVLSSHGVPVRYDPRSYKDMGLDIEPMPHTRRIIADKQAAKGYVVRDEHATRQRINRESEQTANQRFMAWKALVKSQRRVGFRRTGPLGPHVFHKDIFSGRIKPEDILKSAGLATSRQLFGTVQQRMTANVADQAALKMLALFLEATREPENEAPDVREFARRLLRQAAQEEVAAIGGIAHKRNAVFARKITGTVWVERTAAENWSLFDEADRSWNELPPTFVTECPQQQEVLQKMETSLPQPGAGKELPETPSSKVTPRVKADSSVPLSIVDRLRERMNELTDMVIEESGGDLEIMHKIIAALAEQTRVAQRAFRNATEAKEQDGEEEKQLKKRKKKEQVQSRKKDRSGGFER
ncbi:MobA/MobL family protein [Acetobacter sp. AN02]|uniref:MobA/MobL family protein n=1 Tax=Acetobacter sp. AN02 TaxID=2894186 RepID=UPI0024342B21|nr:MobA/MobL family protein [Acetobacter sp. AN02]MDG6093736.1 MobA/MobL family protein [Acetobacter sp. AN02]